MLSATENSLTKFFILIREWIMNDSESALVFNGETNQNSHSRQVTLHKVIGSVKRVNPNDSISGIESFEFFN